MRTNLFAIIVMAILTGAVGGGRAAAQCMENIGHRYSTTFTRHGDTLVPGVTFGEEKMKINYSCQRQQDGSIVVSGMVTFARTGEALPYVTVSSLYEIYGEKCFVPWEELAVTDSLGRFAFRRPALSQRTLAFCSVGFRTELFEEHWDTIAVSEQEYLAQRDVSQRFDTTAVGLEEWAELMTEYYEEFQTRSGSDEYAWIESEGLRCRIGRFMPSGALGVHFLWPVDDRRSIALNGMRYLDFPADRLFAFSPEGLLASQSPSSGDSRDHLHISLIDRYEVSGFYDLALDSTQGFIVGLRWAEGGWLYFRTEHGGCYKLHVYMRPRTNCRLEDVEVSEAEFLAAKASSAQYNHTRTQRAPTAADSAAVLRYLRENDLRGWDPLGADSGDVEYLHIEGTDIDEVSFVIGDLCNTFILGDTTEMYDCRMSLSREGVYAGIWVPNDAEIPSYIHLYPLSDDRRSVKQRLFYQTTPAWFPFGEYFWSRDGWLYLEGYAGTHDHAVYHKVRLDKSASASPTQR